MTREMHCEHGLPLAECPTDYPIYLQETTVGDVLGNRVYGKSEEWRDAADRLIESLAFENKYIVGEMLIVFLESAGYGLQNYSPLGGVFKRAAKRGIVKRLKQYNNQTRTLWYSCVYKGVAK